MNGSELILGLGVGVALAASCGFRVFVPLFVASLAAHGGHVTLASNMQWVGSDLAVFALGAATALEIAGYYVPWIDNALDTIATPAAGIAGTLATASFITGMDPTLQWTVSAIAGGGIATAVQLTTVATRAVSTVTTAGLGNPVVSTVEATAATGLSIIAIVLPLLAIVLVVLLMSWLGRLVFRRRRRQPATVPAMS